MGFKANKLLNIVSCRAAVAQSSASSASAAASAASSSASSSSCYARRNVPQRSFQTVRSFSLSSSSSFIGNENESYTSYSSTNTTEHDTNQKHHQSSVPPPPVPPPIPPPVPVPTAVPTTATGVPTPNPFTEKSMELVKEIADTIRQSVRSYTSNHELKLIGITASRSRSILSHQSTSSLSSLTSSSQASTQLYVDEGIESYSQSVYKTCIEDGITFELWRIAGDTTTTTTTTATTPTTNNSNSKSNSNSNSNNALQRQLDNMVHRANTMSNVHGILMFYPLMSNKPQILGWVPPPKPPPPPPPNNDTHKNDKTNPTNIAINKRKWSIDQEQQNIQKGYDQLLEQNRKRLPGLSYKTRDDYYRSSICHERDVEGLCPHYHSRSIFRNTHLYVDTFPFSYDTDVDTQNEYMSDNNTSTTSNSEILFPCTALAVVRILKRLIQSSSSSSQKQQNNTIGKRFKNNTITIINRSEIVGRPLASMLANDGATVYSIDEDSILLYSYNKMKRVNVNVNVNDDCDDDDDDDDIRNMMDVESCIQQSNIVITAVPSSTFKIPTSYIQPNTIVINVSSEPNIDEEELSCVEGVTYVPQIGKVTVALLEHNLMTLHQRHHSTI